MSRGPHGWTRSEAAKPTEELIVERPARLPDEPCRGPSESRNLQVKTKGAPSPAWNSAVRQAGICALWTNGGRPYVADRQTRGGPNCHGTPEAQHRVQCTAGMTKERQKRALGQSATKPRPKRRTGGQRPDGPIQLRPEWVADAKNWHPDPCNRGKVRPKNKCSRRGHPGGTNAAPGRPQSRSSQDPQRRLARRHG